MTFSCHDGQLSVTGQLAVLLIVTILCENIILTGPGGCFKINSYLSKPKIVKTFEKISFFFIYSTYRIVIDVDVPIWSSIGGIV